MHAGAATPLQRVKIDYLQDTLLGVNPLSCECMAKVMEAGASVSLQILPPWPEQLLKAHTVQIKTEGRTYHGVVVDAGKNNANELLVTIKLQG
ncbi:MULTISPECIES: hypothetical protein [Pseudomonas]|uniref:hypothetical protein n=1 Tax=Pseudomonas TaxID=286 RepID=UPI001C0A8D74|nr:MULTISPECIES: hypothetical protein [Pseudomonas]MCK3839212.1 hypothetical protein [Pseudomonas sp. NCIMB 10586]VCU62469.1 hypothetical protein [Pseudomonas synxantha]